MATWSDKLKNRWNVKEHLAGDHYPDCICLHRIHRVVY